jgi:hypothetical protein
MYPDLLAGWHRPRRGQGRCPCRWPAASVDFGCGRCGWAGIGAAAGGRRGVPLGGPGGRPRGFGSRGGVQDELADQLAGVAVDHSDVSVVDEQVEWRHLEKSFVILNAR